MTTAPRSVSLDVATPADSVLLGNLLELYIHDMSEVFRHVELGPDGRFGYKHLPLYWSEPDRRFAFLIRYDGRIAGFCLVTRGSPAVSDPDVLDLAEFFVIRQYRRGGVGQQAAFLLWHRLPGTWIVRVLEANRGARAFWKDSVGTFTHGTFTESKFAREPNEWCVFTFESRTVHSSSTA